MNEVERDAALELARIARESELESVMAAHRRGEVSDLIGATDEVFRRYHQKIFDTMPPPVYVEL